MPWATKGGWTCHPWSTASDYCCDAERRRRMEVSGAAPDWALVRELAPLLCCRSAWTTQIGQRLGPFRGGQGLAGGCDCVQMPCQCNAQCTANSSGLQPLAAAEGNGRAPPSMSFLDPFLGLWRLWLEQLWLLGHLAAAGHYGIFIGKCVRSERRVWTRPSSIFRLLLFLQTTSIHSALCILHSAPFRCLRRTGTYAVLLPDIKSNPGRRLNEQAEADCTKVVHACIMAPRLSV